MTIFIPLFVPWLYLQCDKHNSRMQSQLLCFLAHQMKYYTNMLKFTKHDDFLSKVALWIVNKLKLYIRARFKSKDTSFKYLLTLFKNGKLVIYMDIIKLQVTDVRSFYMKIYYGLFFNIDITILLVFRNYPEWHLAMKTQYDKACFSHWTRHLKICCYCLYNWHMRDLCLQYRSVIWKTQ